jgi:hypothetical protein
MYHSDRVITRVTALTRGMAIRVNTVGLDITVFCFVSSTKTLREEENIMAVKKIIGGK